MEIAGRVVRKPFGTGSKSEHEAVVLESETGDYVLRLEGGNPFRDPRLDALVGKTVRCDGFRAGYAFVVRSWRETTGAHRP